MLISVTSFHSKSSKPDAPHEITADLHIGYLGYRKEFIPVGAVSMNLNQKGKFGPKMASELLSKVALILGDRTRWIKDKGENLRLRKK